MSKAFKELKKQLEPRAKWTILQRRPVTIAVVEVTYNEERYVDFGYSKVNWPDRFSRGRGVVIAKGKAIDHVENRIINALTEPLYVSENVFAQTINSANSACIEV